MKNLKYPKEALVGGGGPGGGGEPAAKLVSTWVGAAGSAWPSDKGDGAAVPLCSRPPLQGPSPLAL